MIKRRQGAHVRSRSYHSQCRELRLMAITHNVMILWREEVFYRASQDSLFSAHRVLDEMNFPRGVPNRCDAFP